MVRTLHANAGTDAPQGTREINISLFGWTAHFSVSIGALGAAVILTLTILLMVAVLLAVVARHRRREAEAANRKLENEIRERERVQEEINNLNADLERIVAERTEQLRDANKQLEAFSYSVAHDLKAPLRAINGFCHILMEDYGSQLDGEAQRYLNSIARGAETMGNLITALLEFSRQGLKEMTLSHIDMNDLVGSVLEELRRTITERKVEWKLQSLPPIRGDRAMIRQVWVNLLSNAIKFTQPKENALVEVGCSERGADQNTYYVKDNGAGFDMQFVGKLFGMFQRLHATEKFQGTGLGLSIVQRVVQRHGGRVWAEGKVNEGATFHFTLPAEEENHRKTAQSASCERQLS
jgi:light-regulated signal transduction histidine kinase (bacteriophytochrome)